MSPTLGGTAVSGDANKFRELYWQREGWNGGLADLLLTDKSGDSSTVTLEGRALLNDYRVVLTMEKKELGFARFGWEQYRKFYDDTGGYYPNFTPSVLSLNQDLYLDLGRAWVDFGLTLPDWPRMVLGYEYQYRDGQKSTLQWGAVDQGGEARSIYPAAKAIDERVHIIKFDLDYDFRGLQFVDNFRGEFYDIKTHSQNTEVFTLGNPAPSRVADVHEQTSYFQGANALRLEKPFTDWLLGSLGYLYSKLNADATFSLDTLFPNGSPGFGDRWRSDATVLEQETQVLNATALIGPWKGLSLTAGVLSEWTQEETLGNLSQDLVFPSGFVLPYPATFDGNLQKTMTEESVGLRYTTIPFTVLFAEARLQQESIGQFAEEIGGPEAFANDTDATSNLNDFRTGFSTSPWQRVVFSAQYRYAQKDTDYDNVFKEPPIQGYPAFILWRDVDTDEVEAKLTLRPTPWLKTTFTYKYLTAEYRMATDSVGENVAGDISPGGALQSADNEAHIYSLNAAVTRWRRLYLSGTFSYQNSRMVSFANNTPAVVPYTGDLYSVMASVNYAISTNTDWQTTYTFSWADYAQNNFADGLPLGIQYHQNALTTGISRRFSRNLSAKLQYGFYNYAEPSGGGANNFTANAVFATLSLRLP